MKKYLYTGFLLGTIVLAGCSVNEKTEGQIIEEPLDGLTDGKTVEIEPLADTGKIKVSAVPLALTQEQKEDYYKEYSKIVAEVSSEYPNQNLSIETMDKFKQEDWLELEEFKRIVSDRANAKITVLTNTDIYAPDLVPKTANFHIGSSVRTIRFTGSFETQLSSNTPNGRQLFSWFDSISSQVESGGGIWIQTGYDHSMTDGGRTYLITVGGKYSQGGVSSSHNIEVEFNCNKNGGIS